MKSMRLVNRIKSCFQYGLLVVSIATLLSACQEQKSQTETSDAQPVKTTSSSEVSEKQSNKLTASEISKKYIITDTHIDVPYRLEEEYEDVANATDKGDFDYPRAKMGGSIDEWMDGWRGVNVYMYVCLYICMCMCMCMCMYV